MAIDGSAFSLRLGFKDSPTVGDDFIDLNTQSFSAGTPTKGRGILLQSGGFAPGPIETDPKWGPVQTLTITVRIDGDSKDDAIGLLRTLNRFIQRSNFYFQDSGDNVSSRSDGKWHDGEAAVLTFQPADATYASYFDVIAGTPAQLPDLITLSTTTLNSVSFSLKIRAGSRLSRVRLDNVVAMGDAAKPFQANYGTSGGTFSAGWFFSGSTDWKVSANDPTSLAPKFGTRVLTNQLSPATFTTNPGEVSTGDKVIPDLWIAASPGGVTGTFTVKMQTFNGSVWADQQTFVSVSSWAGLLSPSLQNPNWLRYPGAAYTVPSGVTQVRLTGTTPTLGTIAIDGVAIWRNPVNNVVPATEYATGGKTMGIPAFNVYGLRGDVKTPIKMRLENTSATQAERFFIVGGMTQNLGKFLQADSVEQPLFGIDLYTSQSGTTNDPTFPWGALPLPSSGAASSTDYMPNNGNLPNLDRRQRLYRVFIVYAANNFAAITSVKLNISFNSGNIESKTFNTALPQTYTGISAPTGSQYGIFDLGDFHFSRPGIAWEENIPFYNASVPYLTLTHSTSTSRFTAVAGLILIPQKVGAPMAASVDVGTGSVAPLAVEIYNEGKAPRAAAQPTPMPANFPVELSSFNQAANLKGGNLWVLPTESSGPTTAMRFEVLMLRSRDATTKLFSFDARDTKQVSIEYTPRYLYGMAS